MKKPMIQEWIVVEGKDDIAALKRAVEAHVIATSGLGIEESTLELIEKAAVQPGVIVFTDPDFPGEKIRRIINERIPGCKNAYLPKEDGLKDGNVGVENATPQAIRKALENAKAKVSGERIYSQEDLMDLGLLYGKDARCRRRVVGEHLGIGYANAKQFLERINSYGITREQLILAVEKLEEGRGK